MLKPDLAQPCDKVSVPQVMQCRAHTRVTHLYIRRIQRYRLILSERESWCNQEQGMEADTARGEGWKDPCHRHAGRVTCALLVATRFVRRYERRSNDHSLEIRQS